MVLLPLTDATRGMIGAAELAAMRDGALLVNAGRGPVVDADALVAELARGRLEAVLDVTDPEPLPGRAPLWELALAITPHYAGDSEPAEARALALAAEQLGRFAPRRAARASCVARPAARSGGRRRRRRPRRRAARSPG